MEDKINNIKELFSNFQELTPESVEKIVGETLKVFSEIMGKLNSSDEKERTEALAMATELRETLEKQAKEAMKAAGMDEEELQAFLSNPQNFSSEEWGSLQQAKGEMKSFQSNLKEKGFIKDDKKKKNIKKSSKTVPWVQG